MATLNDRPIKFEIDDHQFCSPKIFLNFFLDEGEGESKLCSIFESMMHYRVSIIILDEIDIIADKVASIYTGINFF